MKDLLLAIDNGTQSVRALLFDLQGNLVAKARVPFEPYVAPQPGWAEQDPDYYWRAALRACQQLWQQAGDMKERIAGVALTTQRRPSSMSRRAGRSAPRSSGSTSAAPTGLKPVGGCGAWRSSSWG